MDHVCHDESVVGEGGGVLGEFGTEGDEVVWWWICASGGVVLGESGVGQVVDVNVVSYATLFDEVDLVTVNPNLK